MEFRLVVMIDRHIVWYTFDIVPFKNQNLTNND